MAEAKAYEQEYGQYEIINGKVVMMRPAATNHRRIQRNLAGIIYAYLKGKRCELFLEEDVYLEDKSHFVPDLIIVCDKSKIKEFHVEGAPDLVVEILSAGTQKRDLGIKKDTYERFGVREYWIVNPWDKSIVVYHLVNGKYQVDDVYRDHPEEYLAQMPEEERAEVKLSLKVSLYQDLEIDVREIFGY